MPTGSITATGKTGPGNTGTSIALAGITKIVLDVTRGVIQVNYGVNQFAEFDYTQTTTFTDTITGANSVFVAS